MVLFGQVHAIMKCGPKNQHKQTGSWRHSTGGTYSVAMPAVARATSRPTAPEHNMERPERQWRQLVGTGDTTRHCRHHHTTTTTTVEPCNNNPPPPPPPHHHQPPPPPPPLHPPKQHPPPQLTHNVFATLWNVV